jgi:8-oxo-dGTP pyrophosphatase MutT (NUDIX family)
VQDNAFVVNVEVIVVRDNRFLMIVRGDEDFGAGWLTFPGGKLDWEGEVQEALEGTARREVLEEVGLDVEPPVSYVESHTFAIGDVHVLDIVMLAQAGEGEARRNSPGEVADILWMTADEIMADPRVQPWTRASLSLALARLPSVAARQG